MGDILNIAAVHDAGDAKLNVGIRGNRFVLKKNGNVVYLVTAGNSRMDLDANFKLSDGTSVENRILDAETQLEEMAEILDHLYEMVSTDEYWAALEVGDGVLLVDDATEYPIVDNWSVDSAIADLQNRVFTLEKSVSTIGDTLTDVLRTLQDYNSHIVDLELRQKQQASLLISTVRELIALRTATNSALNHRFLVDDS